MNKRYTKKFEAADKKMWELWEKVKQTKEYKAYIKQMEARDAIRDKYDKSIV